MVSPPCLRARIRATTELGRSWSARGCRPVPVTLPLGVDLTDFAPLDRRPPTFDHLRLGYVGRLHPHKGIPVLLQAIVPLPGVSAVIVGDGPEAEGLKELAQSLSIEGRVQFVGHANYRSLADLYRELDVVVIPSVPTRRWDEQFCRVAVEAMASGVPIVASNTGALPEVIGDAGILVPPGDPRSLAKALEGLASVPERWQVLRQRGLASVERFTWETVATRQHALYLASVSLGADLARPAATSEHARDPHS